MRGFFLLADGLQDAVVVMVDRAENTTETVPIISSFSRLELDGNRTLVIGNARYGKDRQLPG